MVLEKIRWSNSPSGATLDGLRSKKGGIESSDTAGNSLYRYIIFGILGGGGVLFLLDRVFDVAFARIILGFLDGVPDLVLFGVLAVVFLAFAFIKAPRKAIFNKKLKDFCACRMDADMVMRQLESDLRASDCLNESYYFGEQFMIINSEKAVAFMEPKDIVWVYKAVSTVRDKRDSAISQGVCIVCWDNQGRKVQAEDDEAVIQAILETMANHYPHIVFGWDDHYEGIYRNDPQNFVRNI